VNRGEIRWYTFREPDKRRPVLILTRAELIERINEVIVVPVTRTVRGISSESSSRPRTVCRSSALSTSIMFRWPNALASDRSFHRSQMLGGRK
jgi:mRNA-degrading endonuclease toxin of MazEF toxin-antitoxin module